jgi:GntR family transcriptional regulator
MEPPPFRVDPADPRPIWRQIEEGLLHAITRGDYAVGTPVPSVRDLAKQLRVNPNTVVKVYQHLGDQGLLEVRRGEGTFVAGLPPALARRERESSLRAAAELFVARALREGSPGAEIVRAVEQALTADAKGRRS